MQQTDYRIVTEYIELNQLLKICGLAGSGGEGGVLVTQGNVTVDGQQELRKRCKVRPGQVVQLGDVRISVLAADPEEIAAKAESRIEQAKLKAARKKATQKPPAVWSTAKARSGSAPRTSTGGNAGVARKPATGPKGGPIGGAKPGPKARSGQIKAGARVAAGSGAAVNVVTKAAPKPKTNIFAEKAEAHRRRKA